MHTPRVSSLDINAGNPKGIASLSPRLLYSATLRSIQDARPTSKRLSLCKPAKLRAPEPFQGSRKHPAHPR